MGSSENQAAGEYLDRDKRIVSGLCSPRPQAQEQAGVELEEQIRWPLATILRGKALDGDDSGLFRYILDDNLKIDQVEYAKIWAGTKAVLLRKVKQEDFELDRSLVAFLVGIAGYLIMEERRRKKNPLLVPITFLNNIADAPTQEFTDLRMAFNEYLETLSEKDRLILKVGIVYKTSDHPTRKTNKELADKIRSSGAMVGLDETVVRKFNRLREDLRIFLRERGYDV